MSSKFLKDVQPLVISMLSFYKAFQTTSFQKPGLFGVKLYKGNFYLMLDSMVIWPAESFQIVECRIF